MPLQRSRKNRQLAGVCGGLAEFLGWDATATRVAFVLVSILSAAFPGIIVYILLWILMPQAPEESTTPVTQP
ncbi:MAG: PspC domain-containing protein [Thermoanaerobaculia bacterium]|nr:PspC domain-containing protein [Thermoanaerobaculia bacterium]